jgi:hypothetical protein
LTTAEVVQAQAPLHIRYPAVNLWRQYVLAAESGFDPAVLGQLHATLLAPDAQQALGRLGFRPVQATPPPTSGPFVTLTANGADWDARWAEAPRSAAFDEWARGWLP